MRRSTSRWLAAGKAATGVAVLFWVLRSVDLARVGETVRHCRVAPLVVGLAALALSVAFQVARLHTLIHRLVPSPFESVRITLGGFLFNQLLPGGLGGEGYRALRLKALSRRWSIAIGLVTLERATGFLVLLIPGAVLAWLDRDRLRRALAGRAPRHLLPSSPGAEIVWIVGALAVLAAAILAYRLSGGLRARLARSLAETRAAFAWLSLRRYLAVVALSLGYQVLQVEGIRWLVSSFGATVSFFDATVVVALTMVVSLVPVSLGSLGVKEGAIVLGLGVYGVGSATGLAVALFNRLVLLVLALAGGLLLTSTAGHRPDPPADRA